MGIEFRDGRYLRRVKFGKRTVKDGEAAVVWARNGAAREIVGPSIERMFYSTIRFLTRHTVTPGQYLVITHKAGNVEHLLGPTTVYENPIKHASIAKHTALNLASERDCIVVVTRSTDTEAISSKAGAGLLISSKAGAVFSRRVIAGPAQFIPTQAESVVTFSWTPHDRELPCERADPAAPPPPVAVINTAPFRLRVKAHLTTLDGLKFVARLELRVRVGNVALAASSADPILAISQSVQNDLAAAGAQFASTDDVEFDQLARGSGRLPGTTAAAASSGLEILEVLVRKVDRPAELVAAEAKLMNAAAAHAAALELAKRGVELEREKTAARLAGASQDRQVVEAEAATALQRAALKNSAEAEQQKHRLRLEVEEQQHRLRLEAETRDGAVQAARVENDVLAEFLGKLKAVDVDLTQYLTAGDSGKALQPSGGVLPATGAVLNGGLLITPCSGSSGQHV